MSGDAGAAFALQAAGPGDLAAVRALLRECALPEADVTPALLRDFLVLRQGAALSGSIGLERAGAAALLRSLAVSPSARGRGHGRLLVAALEQHARAQGLRQLYLLTTTAEAFFAALGYDDAPCEQAPAAIAQTAEFRSLCPASARFMAKAL